MQCVLPQHLYAFKRALDLKADKDTPHTEDRYVPTVSKHMTPSARCPPKYFDMSVRHWGRSYHCSAASLWQICRAHLYSSPMGLATAGAYCPWSLIAIAWCGRLSCQHVVAVQGRPSTARCRSGLQVTRCTLHRPRHSTPGQHRKDTYSTAASGNSATERAIAPCRLPKEARVG